MGPPLGAPPKLGPPLEAPPRLGPPLGAPPKLGAWTGAGDAVTAGDGKFGILVVGVEGEAWGCDTLALGGGAGISPKILSGGTEINWGGVLANFTTRLSNSSSRSIK